MQIRLKRLRAEYEQVYGLFINHPYIRLTGVEGEPPDRYVFTLNVEGLVPEGEDRFTRSSEHKVEIFLPLDYPRRPPICRMLSPIFHPNIDPQKICIGDHWSAGQVIAQMIVRIAEMICYQSYNTKSPLNAVAAAWADQHLADLPLQAVDLSAGA